MLRRLALAFFAVLSATPVAVAEKAAFEIPLKEVWAYNMPGTRNIRELEPRTEGDQRDLGPLMNGVIRQLRQAGRDRLDAGPGFAVSGTGIAALNEAYDTILAGHQTTETVPPGEVCIVFYVMYSANDVLLESATRNGNVISLKYRFLDRRTRHMTTHFALIPLGKLEPGSYEVRITQFEWATYGKGVEGYAYLAPRTDAIVKQVSQPFKFEVTQDTIRPHTTR